MLSSCFQSRCSLIQCFASSRRIPRTIGNQAEILTASEDLDPAVSSLLRTVRTPCCLWVSVVLEALIAAALRVLQTARL